MQKCRFICWFGCGPGVQLHTKSSKSVLCISDDIGAIGLHCKFEVKSWKEKNTCKPILINILRKCKYLAIKKYIEIIAIFTILLHFSVTELLWIFSVLPSCNQNTSMNIINNTFMHLADAFFQSDLVHTGYTFFFVSMCVPWESNPQCTTLLTQCSNHWATGTVVNIIYVIL